MMSNRTSSRRANRYVLVLGTCILLQMTGCKSTNSRLATVPGLGWLSSKESVEGGELASDLPPPSSVTSPEPIRPQDEVLRTATAATAKEPSAEYPVTQYPAIQPSTPAASGIRTASAVTRAPANYETGPYDRKVTSGAPGNVAPPESVAAGGAAQPGMYDSEYQEEAPNMVGEAAQSTWEGESSAPTATIPSAPVDDEVPPSRFERQSSPAAAPTSTPPSMQSEWVGDLSTAAPAATKPAPGELPASTRDLGYAANAVAQQPYMDNTMSTRQVNHEEPVKESKPTTGSVYEAKPASHTSGTWRPGSTSSYR